MLQERVFKKPPKIRVLEIFPPNPKKGKGKEKESYIFIVYITSNITGEELLVFLVFRV